MRLSSENLDKPNQQSLSPLIQTYCNFRTARKMAQENLEHQPLPDCIMNVIPTTSGVGIKTYEAEPTHYTKMYRPKTCGVVPKPLIKLRGQRPQTSFVYKDKVGAIDLAICWDYRPSNPADEPKPPKHIDGSNGSVAPPVFTLVKNSSSAEKPYVAHSAGIFTNTLGNEDFFDRDILRRQIIMPQRSKSDLKCSCGTSPINLCTVNNIRRSKSASREPTGITDKYHQFAPNTNGLNTQTYAKDQSDEKPIREHSCRTYGANSNTNNSKQNAMQKISRLCHKVSPQDPDGFVERPPFKAAFKAGTPKSNSTGTVRSFDSGFISSNSSAKTCSTKLHYIPKPRPPYAKKSYNIDTLVPPFTCFRGGAGQGGYPEYWRLSSVYQHAYKPIEQRKRPLLETVYK